MEKVWKINMNLSPTLGQNFALRRVFFLKLPKRLNMAKLIGATLIITGFVLGLFALKQRSAWISLSTDQKVQLLLQKAIQDLVTKSKTKPVIRTWKVQVHSQTLIFLLNGRSLNRIINPEGTFDLEVDLFDIVTDEQIKGFVAQSSMINVKTKNKEAEFSENVDLKELNQSSGIFSSSPVSTN